MSLQDFLNIPATDAKAIDPKRTATVPEIERAAEGNASRCLLLPELLNTTGCEMFWKVAYSGDDSGYLLVPVIKSHVRSLLDEGKPLYVAEAEPSLKRFVLAIVQNRLDLPRLAPYAGGEFFSQDLKSFMSSVTIKRIRAVAMNRGFGRPIQGADSFSPPRERAPVEPKTTIGYLTPAVEGDSELDMSGLRSKASGVEDFIPPASRVLMEELQSLPADHYFSLHDFCLAVQRAISTSGKPTVALTKAHYRAAKTLLTGAGFAVFNRKRMGSQGNLIPVFGSVQAQMRFIDRLNNEAQSTEERNKLYADQRFRFEGIEGEDNSGYDGDDE